MDSNSTNRPNRRAAARPHEYRAHQRSAQTGPRRRPEQAHAPRSAYRAGARPSRAAGQAPAAQQGSKRKLAFALAALVAVLAVVVVLRVAVAAPGQGSGDGASASAQVAAQAGFESQGSRASDGDVTTVKTSAGALSTTRSEADRSATSDSDNGYDAKPDQKTVYLTFDDGPSANTDKILEILNRYGVHATWFVVGTSSHLDSIEKIWDDGNQVGLHSQTHDYSTDYATDTSYEQGLETLAGEVEQRLGFKPTVIRFPGGSKNSYDGKVADGSINAVTAAGLHYFDWNVENGDATGNNLPVSKLVANVEKEAAGDNSCCVLMHDLESKSTTVEALPQIIQYFIDQGYTFDVLTASSCGYHF